MTDKEIIREIRTDVKWIIETLKKDCTRIDKLESDSNRAKGAMWIMGGAAGFLGTILGHFWGKK